jgi:hypothetical protein
MGYDLRRWLIAEPSPRVGEDLFPEGGEGGVVRFKAQRYSPDAGLCPPPIPATWFSSARETFLRGSAMNSTEMMKREILRLAGVTTRSAFISVRRLSTFYNVPEKTVRRELTNMAEENRIRLAGWDGRQVRPLTEWRNREEFVENAPEGFPVRVELVE